MFFSSLNWTINSKGEGKKRIVSFWRAVQIWASVHIPSPGLCSEQGRALQRMPSASSQQQCKGSSLYCSLHSVKWETEKLMAIWRSLSKSGQVLNDLAGGGWDLGRLNHGPATRRNMDLLWNTLPVGCSSLELVHGKSKQRSWSLPFQTPMQLLLLWDRLASNSPRRIGGLECLILPWPF